jgi:hypothetical protein
MIDMSNEELIKDIKASIHKSLKKKKKYHTKEEWDQIKLEIKKAKEQKIIPESKPEPKKINKVLILLPINASIIIALVYIFLIGKWM